MTHVWIAERELRLKSGEADLPIHVRMAAPSRVSNEDYFQCTFRIEGLDFEEERSIYGSDGIQAMQLATVIIGSLLVQLGEDCSWDGQRGYTGFPISIQDPVMGKDESSNDKVSE